MTKKTLLALLTTYTLSSTALAGGYQLQEYSVVNLGRAFGGAGIVGDDYSAIAFNPAGMILKGSGIQIGNSTVRIRSHGTGTLTAADASEKSGKGTIKALANLPHFFAQKKISDNLTLGTGLYVPFGLGTYYRKKDWFASNHAINSEISAIDTALAASYKFSDHWSIGASFIMEYLNARLTNNLSNGTGTIIGSSDMNADSWKPGYSVGIMYQPSKDSRLGIAYRSKIVHKIKGPHYLSAYTPAGIMKFQGHSSSTLTLPEHVLISAYHKVGKWGFSAMARWTRWSHFDTLSIKSTATTKPVAPVNEDWKNVWMIGGGIDYDLNNNWTLRSGLAWDEGAVKRAETRTARVPDTNRILTSLGASYKNGNWQWDFAYAHMFWRTAHLHNTLASDASKLDAKYHTKLDIVALGLQYNF